MFCNVFMDYVDVKGFCFLAPPAFQMKMDSFSYFWHIAENKLVTKRREKTFLFFFCESSKKGFHFLFEDPYAKNIM